MMSHAEAKSCLIFSANSILQQKHLLSSFCLELLSLTEANFLHLLYCPRLLLLFLKNVLLKNPPPTPKVCAVFLISIKIEEK